MPGFNGNLCQFSAPPATSASVLSFTVNSATIAFAATITTTAFPAASSYEVGQVSNGATDVLGSVSAGGPLRYTASGLASETVYSFAVRAINSVGRGPWSAPVSVTTLAAIPTAPTSLSGVALSSSSVSLSWSYAGSFISYSVRYTSGVTTVTLVSLTNSITISNLAAAQQYTFAVSVTNSRGSGSSASVSVTTNPAAPAIASLVASDPDNGDAVRFCFVLVSL